MNKKPKAKDLIVDIYEDYVGAYQVMATPHPFLEDKSPFDYFNEGRKLFNSYDPPRSDDTDWKTKYRSHKTRNRVLGLVAHLVTKNVEQNITAQNENQEEDVLASRFFRDAVLYSQDLEGWERKSFWLIVTMLAEGTVIVGDNYGRFRRMVKDITGMDKDGILTWTEKEMKDFTGAYTEIVPNDELMPKDPFCFDIQEQDWIIRRRRMQYNHAKRLYGKSLNFDEVIPGKSTGWVYDHDVFKSYDSFTELKEREVEVIERWDKPNDLLHIVANGVELVAEDNPIPRPDKQYPWAKGIAEPADGSLFWGVSLAIKAGREQDVTDTLTRIIIDKSHLTTIPPTLTNEPGLVNEDIIVPGLTTYSSVPSGIQVIPGMSSGVDAGTFQILQLLTNEMNESTVDPIQRGQSDGGSITATQVLQQAKNADIITGLYGRMVGDVITEWCKLRLQTILWRLANDENLGRITVYDQILTSGKVGKRTYIFKRGIAKEAEAVKAKLASQIRDIEGQAEQKMELVIIDPNELHSLELFVHVGATPKPRRTDDLMKALAMEKWQLYGSRPDIFNQKRAGELLVTALEDDPDEMIQEAPPTPNPASLPQGAEMAQARAPGVSPNMRQSLGMAVPPRP